MSNIENQKESESIRSPARKRHRRQVERLRVAENNDDHLFDEVDLTEENSPAVNLQPINQIADDLISEKQTDLISEEHSQNTQKNDEVMHDMSPGEKIIFKAVLEMAAEMKVFNNGSWTLNYV